MDNDLPPRDEDGRPSVLTFDPLGGRETPFGDPSQRYQQPVYPGGHAIGPPLNNFPNQRASPHFQNGRPNHNPHAYYRRHGFHGERPGQPPNFQPRRIPSPSPTNGFHRPWLMDRSRAPTPIPWHVNGAGWRAQGYEQERGPLPDFPIGDWDAKSAEVPQKKVDPQEILRDFTRRMQINQPPKRRQTPPRKIVSGHPQKPFSGNYSRRDPPHQNLHPQHLPHPNPHRLECLQRLSGAPLPSTDPRPHQYTAHLHPDPPPQGGPSPDLSRQISILGLLNQDELSPNVDLNQDFVSPDLPNGQLNGHSGHPPQNGPTCQGDQNPDPKSQSVPSTDIPRKIPSTDHSQQNIPISDNFHQKTPSSNHFSHDSRPSNANPDHSIQSGINTDHSSQSSPKPDHSSQSSPKPDHSSQSSPKPDHSSQSSPKPDHSSQSSSKPDHSSQSSPKPDHSSQSSPKPDHSSQSSPKPDHSSQSSPKPDHSSQSSPKPDHSSQSTPDSDHSGKSTPSADQESTCLNFQSLQDVDDFMEKNAPEVDRLLHQIYELGDPTTSSIGDWYAAMLMESLGVEVTLINPESQQLWFWTPDQADDAQGPQNETRPRDCLRACLAVPPRLE